MYEYIEQLIELIDLTQNRPLNDIVYEGLRGAVIKGVIPVGERINEKVYADYLNISRTPIRKAIEKLREEGIIEHIPNYGVVVKRVTIEDVEEIYKIRVALETLATITAMEQMTEENHNRMVELLKITENANARGEVETVIQYFYDFNSLLFEFARMPRLEIVVGRLKEYLARFRDISLFDEVRRAKALEEHGMIYHGLKTKDVELVALIVSEHLNYSKEFVIAEIQQAEKDQADMLRGVYGK